MSATRERAQGTPRAWSAKSWSRRFMPLLRARGLPIKKKWARWAGEFPAPSPRPTTTRHSSDSLVYGSAE